MLVYYAVIGVELVFGLALCGIKTGGKTLKAVYCIFSWLLLGGLSAIRYSVGTDYSYVYAPFYERILLNPSLPFTQAGHEWGFVLFEKGLALVSKNYQMLFIATSFVIVGLFMLYYYLYAPNPLFSVFLFLVLSQFYCSMNFIRQTLAAVIGLYAITFLQQRCFWKYALIVLIASTFHISALILLPFYLINLIRINKWVLTIYVSIAGIIYLNSYGLIAFVVQYVYKHYDVGSPQIAQGFPLFYFLSSLLVFVLIYAFQGVLTKRQPENYVYVNYAFFAMLFVFLGVKHSILDRFSLYFSLGAPIAVSIILVEMHAHAHAPGAEEASASPAKKNWLRFAYLPVILFVALGGLTAHWIALSMDNHGVVPYQIIFEQPFYAQYVEQLRASP